MVNGMDSISCLYFFFLLLLGVRAQEVTTPSNLLGPRHYNHHAFGKQFLQEFKRPGTTQQGPVLFPNDAPPPPRPPLIVTSRPLVESIARSELNPTPPTAPINNSAAESSQISRISYDPGFLTGINKYNTLSARISDPLAYDETYSDTSFGRNEYDDYQNSRVLYPKYKELSHQNRNNNIKKHYKSPNYHYKVSKPTYVKNHQSNDLYEDDDRSDSNDGNYAFSYTVKDKNTGDDFSHSQQSSGSATNGEYRVRLPDGRMQIVSYTADENGYHADVRYDDEVKELKESKIRHNPKQSFIKSKYPISSIHDYNDINNEYNNNQNDYRQQKYDYKNVPSYNSPKANDYYNSDLSKEYYNDDFSLEYDGKDDKYEQHKSKFALFADKEDSNSHLGVIVVPSQKINNNILTSTTVKPPYDPIKYLFVPKKQYSIQPSSTISYNNSNIAAKISVPSTTASLNLYDTTTERVVIIGGTKPSLYTDIRHTIPPMSATPLPISYTTPAPQFHTPSSYLMSTVASLRKNVDLSGSTPVLSNSFIDRINKYLTFK